MPFSRAQKQAVFEWGTELGAKDVPSLSALGKAQSALKAELGDPTIRQVSPQGNIFYINDPKNAVAKVCHYNTYVSLYAYHGYNEGFFQSCIAQKHGVLPRVPQRPNASSLAWKKNVRGRARSPFDTNDQGMRRDLLCQRASSTQGGRQMVFAKAMVHS